MKFYCGLGDKRSKENKYGNCVSLHRQHEILNYIVILSR